MKFELLRYGLSQLIESSTQYTTPAGLETTLKDHTKDLGVTMSDDCSFCTTRSQYSYKRESLLSYINVAWQALLVLMAEGLVDMYENQYGIHIRFQVHYLEIPRQNKVPLALYHRNPVIRKSIFYPWCKEEDWRGSWNPLAFLHHEDLKLSSFYSPIRLIYNKSKIMYFKLP